MHQFCETYAAHAAVIRILSQAEIVGEEVWGDGLQLLFRLAEAMTQGMTAAPAAGDTSGGWATAPAEHAELTAVACLMMLERVNYLLSVEVRLPRDEMVDRITAIMFAAFSSRDSQPVFPASRFPASRFPASQGVPHRRDRGQGVPGGGHVVHAEQPGAFPGAHGQHGEWCPPPARPAAGPVLSPTKSLFETATSTGQPVAARSAVCRVSSSECQVFLPKSWAGSMTIPSGRTPAATARSAAAVT